MEPQAPEPAYVPPEIIDLGSLPVLSRGAIGDPVRLLQVYLNQWGFEHTPLKITGLFTPSTLQAVISFQTRFRLIPDGVVWPNTWQYLIPAADTTAQRLDRIRGILFTTFRIHRR